MKQFPHMTDYINEVFEKEKTRLDYIFLRPPILIIYFFFRLVIFPLKYLFHRQAFGFEAKCIDAVLSFGIKYLASNQAIELIIRHVQIEPILYRFILSYEDESSAKEPARQLHGIDGDFSVDTVSDVIRHGLTLAHDDLSYEVVERFDKEKFLANLEKLRNTRPEDHEQFGKKVLEENKKYSLQIFGCTNVVMFVVITITLFGDLRSVVRALNSFGSDSMLLWCMKNIYHDDTRVLIDLVFYMQTSSNRSHYNNSPFFSDPSQYLYYHIAFDEFVYELLRTNPAGLLKGEREEVLPS